MKKYNLLILLLSPFIIALLGMVIVTVSFNSIDNDIIGIDWNYSDLEAFKISDDPIKLYASGINGTSFPLSEGNNLVWSVKNKIESKVDYAEIVKINGFYYLKALNEGEIILTCSNEKGTVFKTLEAVIYKTGAILVSSNISKSQNNIDNINYYGMYDIVDNKLEKASIDLNIKCIPYDLYDTLEISSCSQNIDVDLLNNKVIINDYGDSYFTVSSNFKENTISYTFSFNTVKDGVNVYSYNDLLYCTNKSSEGEIVVLRKSLESLNNCYVTDSDGKLATVDGKLVNKANNIDLFGNYDYKNNSFSFKDEVYSFETTFNDNYIKQWNEFVSINKKYKRLDNKIISGIRLQKDFYGNGYMINMHNLTYPYDKSLVSDENGNIIEIPQLTKDNLFKGPLPFYCLGDPNGMPLVTTYGQDNIGLYIDGNDILVNDLNIKNCDFSNRMANLDTVGTVLETNGNNITIQNSRLQNGRNIIRCYSSDLKLSNSMLSNARNFLLVCGSNEYIRVTDEYQFSNGDNSIKSYLSNDNIGDILLNDYISGNYTSIDEMKDNLTEIQHALNNTTNLEYKGNILVSECIFYRSGISSIALESLFNGPFLYSSSPSLIKEMFDSIAQDSDYPNFMAKMISGISYPVSVKIIGDTRFYDYKDEKEMDLSGLIQENISSIVLNVAGEERKIDIDDIFPLKKMLFNCCRSNDYIYKGKINIPIAYYGGGLNLNSVTFDDNKYDKIPPIDLMDEYLGLKNSNSELSRLKNMMLKTVTTVIGFEPFNFYCLKEKGYLYDETPNVSLLIDNLKGE